MSKSLRQTSIDMSSLGRISGEELLVAAVFGDRGLLRDIDHELDCRARPWLTPRDDGGASGKQRHAA